MDPMEVYDRLGYPGRMLSASKSGYQKAEGEVVFWNANVYDSSGKKIWYGDVSLFKDAGQLKALARDLQGPIYVTREMPFRFQDVALPQLQQEAARAENVVRIDP